MVFKRFAQPYHLHARRAVRRGIEVTGSAEAIDRHGERFKAVRAACGGLLDQIAKQFGQAGRPTKNCGAQQRVGFGPQCRVEAEARLFFIESDGNSPVNSLLYSVPLAGAPPVTVTSGM